MSAAEAVLSAIDSRAVLGASFVVVALVGLVAVALVGHVVMKPVRKTKVGKWAGHHSEARMDRVRDAIAARKRAKAGAS